MGATTGGQNMIQNIITSTVPVRSVRAPKRPPGTVAIRIAMILALLIFLRIEYLIQSTVGRDAQNRGLTMSRFDKLLPDIFFLVPFLIAFRLLAAQYPHGSASEAKRF
jgi:hypothetical protein